MLAPKASAQTRPHGGGNAPQHGTSSLDGGGHNGGGHGSYGGGRAYHGGSSTYGRGGNGTRLRRAVRPYVRYGYGYGYPYRTYAGFRFSPAYPGPGHVYITNLGWALPPFLGAVWVPGHYDIGGFWVEGFWR